MTDIQGFEDVRPGQHYVYAIGGGQVLDEEVVAIDGAAATLRLRRGRAPVVEARIPLDVLRFIKTARPEFPLTDWNTRGYTAGYFREQAKGWGGQVWEAKGHATLTVSGRRFPVALAGGEQMVRTRTGCVRSAWTGARATRYPFVLRYERDGAPIAVLREIKP